MTNDLEEHGEGAPVAAAPGETLQPQGAGHLPDAVFRMIVDSSANPFVVIGPEGTLRYVGASVEKTLGWRPEELPGRNMAEFLPPDQVPLALEAIGEIDKIDRAGAGVPMVFAVLRPDGQTTWVEIGAMPLLDTPDVEAIVLRHRPWDAQHHFDSFVNALLAADQLDDVLVALARSAAAALEAEGAIVHHGFDGTRFAGVVGIGVPDECLALGLEPACEVARTATSRNLAPADLPLPACSAAGLEAAWFVPVPLTGGLPPAVLSAWRRPSGDPLIGHRHALDRYTRYVELALVRTAEHQRLRHLAGHDALTGVANRTQFRDRLADALAIGECDLAVAFCDLDDFKPVNDTYGHHEGDAVLVQVADRLRASLRAGDELARIGGDEFTVLMRNVPDPESARHVAERLQAAIRPPFRAASDAVALGMSVGIALTEPGASADALLVRADGALYEAKRAGGGTVRVAG